MTTLVANDAMLATLQQAKELVEVRDANGNVIGFFAPVALDRAPLYAQAAARVDPTKAQERRSPDRPAHVTTQVLQHLDSLERT